MYRGLEMSCDASQHDGICFDSNSTNYTEYSTECSKVGCVLSNSDKVITQAESYSFNSIALLRLEQF